ncbi:hypothetical protein COO60DRAFT_463776 [Scenedesmus sp. NREL 46B-D3]|nr:hypothetical protein COO60DRAFT_463776 [Scenedesmus sp. NREL 46B-D3]
MMFGSRSPTLQQLYPGNQAAAFASAILVHGVCSRIHDCPLCVSCSMLLLSIDATQGFRLIRQLERQTCAPPLLQHHTPWAPARDAVHDTTTWIETTYGHITYYNIWAYNQPPYHVLKPVLISTHLKCKAQGHNAHCPTPSNLTQEQRVPGAAPMSIVSGGACAVVQSKMYTDKSRHLLQTAHWTLRVYKRI